MFMVFYHCKSYKSKSPLQEIINTINIRCETLPCLSLKIFKNGLFSILSRFQGSGRIGFWDKKQLILYTGNIWRMEAQLEVCR